MNQSKLFRIKIDQWYFVYVVTPLQQMYIYLEFLVGWWSGMAFGGRFFARGLVALKLREIWGKLNEITMGKQ